MIPGEEAALQHMMIDRPHKSSANSPCPKVWKLRDPQRYSQFQEVTKAHVPAVETGVAATTKEDKKKAKIRNRYNQVPHLTQDTIRERD